MSPAVGSSSSWHCMTTAAPWLKASYHVSTDNELDYLSPPEACSVCGRPDDEEQHNYDHGRDNDHDEQDEEEDDKLCD